jgi:hypothetical protein
MAVDRLSGDFPRLSSVRMVNSPLTLPVKLNQTTNGFFQSLR